MAKKKYRCTRHAIIRIRERYDLAISHNEIKEHLKKDLLVPAKKMTNSRSLYYGKINGKPIKAIINNQKIVVTVLPFIEQYETCFLYVLNEYRIKIYPDCYIETNNSRLLTIFEKYNKETGKYEKCKKKSDPFDTIFNLAWMTYMKGIRNDKIEIEKETAVAILSAQA